MEPRARFSLAFALATKGIWCLISISMAFFEKELGKPNLTILKIAYIGPLD